MERAEGVEELGLRDGEGKLGEGVGDVESGRERIGDQVGEAEEADGAALLGGDDERGSVPLGACWSRVTVG